MFLEQFIEWQQKQPEDAQFKNFAQKWIHNKISLDENFTNFFTEIIYQIYLLQCCIEGLIEDAEITHEEIQNANKRGIKNNKKRS